jgi:uncharacterized membrane protein YedE/YeeE
MVTRLSTFLSGLLFSLGVIFAGMVKPGRVQSFLDVTGDWNPAVGITLLSALLVAMPAYYWVRRNKFRTLQREPTHIPRSVPAGRHLLAGGLVFGLGWGLAGFDPGSGLVAAASGNQLALIFMLAVVVSQHLAFKLDMYLARRRHPAAGST